MTTLPTRSAVHQVSAAIRANALPGVVLWCGLALLLLLYATVPAFGHVLTRWGDVKVAWGLSFAFVSYVVFAVLVPEGLSVALGRQAWTRKTAHDVLYAGLVFGGIGLTVDVLFSVQIHLFGEKSNATTLIKKMLFDQFVYSPVSNYVIVSLFAWREGGFTGKALRQLFSVEFLTHQYLPVLIAMWCVWIPGVMVIYFMPTELQFPVASLVLVFWALIFKFIRKG
jgi:hypothetical protein